MGISERHERRFGVIRHGYYNGATGRPKQSLDLILGVRSSLRFLVSNIRTCGIITVNKDEYTACNDPFRGLGFDEFNPAIPQQNASKYIIFIVFI